jgi:hypothetical protein
LSRASNRKLGSIAAWCTIWRHTPYGDNDCTDARRCQTRFGVLKITWVVVQDVIAGREFLPERFRCVPRRNHDYYIKLARQSVDDLCPLIY